ncbi:orotidine-5'-phosphate decarboxylase [Oceanivirga miroungae]|uniref:Orotidine 5'-phosphate decarboxylase n=1 Tax=Oceanivirga miroungae TaxID=1130046 RepID=A0A6I8MDI5_9FUSO|nr:orotidine-5'-phosphate decarboxylase [Oceanivirga miroungae]VWL85513.1 Orotidine 5'-phosphate decarboxylase [Oceanivirga miroungae]
MIIDRLLKEVGNKSFVCVGLDSDLIHIPESIKSKYESVEDIIFNFNKRIIDCSSDLVAIYKLQIAYYEKYGISGLMAYKRTLKYLKDKNLISIADIKRSDIQSTAKAYAKAHFEGDFEADFITLNPYMGIDTILPYLEYTKKDKGVFVLLLTSNEGAKDIECLNSEGKEIFYHVGDKLDKIAKEFKGESKYSNIGFVVGATNDKEAMKIRNRYENIFFLLPGYGSQNANSNTVKTYLKDDYTGGIVNSSRKIITNYKNYEDGDINFEKYTREAVIDMIADIRGINE